MQYICKIQPCQQHSDILTSYAACSCLTVFTLPCKVFVQIAKRICPNFKMYLLNFGFPTTFWHCDLVCSTPAAATVLKPFHSYSQLLSTHPNSSSGTGLSGSVQTSHNLLFLWSFWLVLNRGEQLTTVTDRGSFCRMPSLVYCPLDTLSVLGNSIEFEFNPDTV